MEGLRAKNLNIDPRRYRQKQISMNEDKNKSQGKNKGKKSKEKSKEKSQSKDEKISLFKLKP